MPREEVIIQISDLHVGLKSILGKEERKKNLAQIVGSLVSHFGEMENSLRILITGDLTEDGSEEQMKDAHATLLPLIEKFNVAIVPGNHDYGRLGNFVDPKKRTLFRTVFGDLPRWSDPGDGNHVFIGLDSMAGQGRKDRFFADGELGKEQRDALDAHLSWCKRSTGQRVVVFLHHHPFKIPFTLPDPVFGLDDKDAFLKIIAGRVDVLLFGHRHLHANFSNYPDLGVEYVGSCGASNLLGSRYRFDGGKLEKIPEPKACFWGRKVVISGDGQRIDAFDIDLLSPL